MLVSLDGDDQIGMIEASLPAIWEQGLDVSDATTVAAVLTAAGLDAKSLAARTQDVAIKQSLIGNTERAIERGVFGIPTFFIGQEMLFGKDALGRSRRCLKAADDRRALLNAPCA